MLIRKFHLVSRIPSPTTWFSFRSLWLWIFIAACPIAAGCIDNAPSEGHVELVWGEHGIYEGKLKKPRAIAIDADDNLYIVDMTGRIQVFTADGEFVRGWKTPTSKNGKPCGLSMDRDGNLLVADTHYFRMLVYKTSGELLEERTIGGKPGPEPGEFEFVTDAVQDSQGNYYIAGYGDHDRIQKYTKDGKFVYEWGGHGQEQEMFIRPQSLAIDEHDHLWVADSCNHRIQVFKVSGDKPELIKIWGEQGRALGQLRYPYGIVLDGKGHIYISEYGNHRIQKFTLDGEFLAALGGPGNDKGQFHQPWSLAQDAKGRLHILDSYNHRVQRIKL